MKPLVISFFSFSCCAIVLAQGGQGGAGFGGGGFGGGAGQGSSQNTMYDRSVAAKNASIDRYLQSEPVKNILTPEGFSEWPLKVKKGQVVIAEAYSDSFDPMLEIAQEEKVQATNDDRYPGDQRPLLLWRCTADGDYSLRARSFRDKAGGQFHIRFNVYDVIDLSGPAIVEADVEEGIFLLRIPMAKGQIKQLLRETPERYLWLDFEDVISPLGLPDARLANEIDDVASDLVVASVAGDYYVMMDADTDGKVRVGTREIVPKNLSIDNAGAANSGSPSLWKLEVKKGDIVELSTPELNWNSGIAVMEMPEFDKFDLSKPETNPFFPPSKDEPIVIQGPIKQVLSKARDSRYFTFVARGDLSLLVAARGYGNPGAYTMNVTNAAIPLLEQENKRKLTIGKTDYWVFDAKVGDVIKFRSNAATFATSMALLGPNSGELRSVSTTPDETSLDMDFFVETPGQYIVSVSCIGNGGGGEYTLARESVSARELRIGAGSAAELTPGDVHVWKLSLVPGDPLLLKWDSDTWDCDFQVWTDKGDNFNFPFVTTAPNTQHAILSVAEPTTLIFVMRPREISAKYRLGLSNLTSGRTE